MYRRILSLLLLPCVVLTQSVAVGHTHGGGQPAGHDLRPHVHTNPVAVESHNAHGHRHGTGGHHRHDDLENTQGPDTQPTPQPEPPSDHDTNAVYVNLTDAVVVERSGPTTQVESHDWPTISDLAFLVAYRACPPARPVVCGHPPPGHLCPLYIRHLALLI